MASLSGSGMPWMMSLIHARKIALEKSDGLWLDVDVLEQSEQSDA